MESRAPFHKPITGRGNRDIIGVQYSYSHPLLSALVLFKWRVLIASISGTTTTFRLVSFFSIGRFHLVHDWQKLWKIGWCVTHSWLIRNPRSARCNTMRFVLTDLWKRHCSFVDIRVTAFLFDWSTGIYWLALRITVYTNYNYLLPYIQQQATHSCQVWRQSIDATRSPRRPSTMESWTLLSCSSLLLEDYFLPWRIQPFEGLPTPKVERQWPLCRHSLHLEWQGNRNWRTGCTKSRRKASTTCRYVKSSFLHYSIEWNKNDFVCLILYFAISATNMNVLHI